MHPTKPSFFTLPATAPGWWAASATALFLLLLAGFLAAAFLGPAPSEPGLPPSSAPNPGLSVILCGLAAGVAGAFALVRKRERSWLVWLSLLPGLFSILILIGDLLAALQTP